MKLQKEIPTNQLREASLRKHYMFLLKRDIVSKDTVKNFARDLESLKYCSALFLLLFCNISFSQTYVKSIKLSNTLATTVNANPSIYKQNIFELKECQNNNDALVKGLKVGMFYCLPMKDNISLIAVVRPKELETKGSIENQTIYMSQEK